MKAEIHERFGGIPNLTVDELNQAREVAPLRRSITIRITTGESYFSQSFWPTRFAEQPPLAKLLMSVGQVEGIESPEHYDGYLERMLNKAVTSEERLTSEAIAEVKQTALLEGYVAPDPEDERRLVITNTGVDLLREMYPAGYDSESVSMKIDNPDDTFLRQVQALHAARWAIRTGNVRLADENMEAMVRSSLPQEIEDIDIATEACIRLADRLGKTDLIDMLEATVRDWTLLDTSQEEMRTRIETLEEVYNQLGYEHNYWLGREEREPFDIFDYEARFSPDQTDTN